MTVEYGYLGSVDTTTVTATPNGVSRLPVLQANGEPVYTPAAPSPWAQELQSSDGAWRFLKAGSAAGRGVGNVFDATLADNFTVLCLGRATVPNYSSLVMKFLNGGSVGWNARINPQNMVTGFDIRIDHTVGANITYPPTASKSAKDLQWHWVAFSLGGVNLRWCVDGSFSSHTRTAGDLANTQPLILNSGGNRVAATLIYNRVLTDTEVSNIMSGKQMPKDVSGLVGYYKFNEAHGNGNGQCTDYSGQGNHLTYSGAVWETYGGNSIANGDFSQGSTGWVLAQPTAGAVTIANGVARINSTDGSFCYIQSTSALTKGAKYRCEFEVVDYVAGNAAVSSGTTTYNSAANAVGRYSFEFIAIDVTFQIKRLSGVTDFTIDNVVVTDLSGQSGQPYVAPTLRNPLNWWERTPPAIADPERMGCVWNISSAPYGPADTEVLRLAGDLSVSAWVMPGNDTRVAVIGKDDTTGYLVLIGNDTTHFRALRVFRNGIESTLTLNIPLPSGRWVHVAVTHVIGAAPRFYLNGVFVGSGHVPLSGTGNYSTGILSLFAVVNTARRQAGRSLRLFSRAITAAEVEELYLMDKITNRSGLVGEWLCNTPHSTTITDTSGNGLHTTTSNPLLLDSPYRVNRRKRFGKQLRISGASSFAINSAIGASLTGSTQLTLAAWHKRSTLLSFPSLVRVRDGSANTLCGLFTGPTANQLLAYASGKTLNGDTITTIFPAAANVPQMGNWTLLSASYNFTAKTLHLYINGVLVAQNLACSNFTQNALGTVGSIQIFATNSQVNDDLRIYNRALTAAEHYALYLDQAPRGGLVAEYTFDSDTTDCQDSSGNGYHATWTGIGLSNYVQEM